MPNTSTNALAEFALGENGGSVFVEISEASRGGEFRAVGSADVVPEKGRTTFEAALNNVEPAARMIMERLVKLSPSELEVEFGLKLNLKLGFFISATQEANFTVKMTWKAPSPPNPGTTAGTQSASM